MRFNLPGYLSPRRLIADRLAASIRPPSGWRSINGCRKT
jgi:hypothetical protein